MSQKVINQAKAFCIEKKERLTKPRIEVLKIIAESSKPIGAYAILDKLSQVLDQPKPPTVYRAIDFWLHTGFIHCIDSLNAYTLCHLGQKHKGTQFMICDDCGRAIEANLCQMPKSLKSFVTSDNFIPNRWTVEIHGLCSHCQS